MKSGFTKNIDKYIFQNIELKPDYEGVVDATLIRYQKVIKGKVPVLYIHGFSDYFFHPHMAERFEQEGYNFFALELRKYGNSIRLHQHANYCRSMFEYFEEIDQTLKIITSESEKKAVLMGHSNGGLIASLYANHGKNKDQIQILILNSPFLDLNLNPIIQKLAIPVLGGIAKIFPYSKVNNIINPLYPKSLDKKFYGEWEINNNWKPIAGFPGYFSWLKAVSDAQKSVAKKSKIEIPILFLHASDSFNPKIWEERIKTSDIILNVGKIKNKANKLGQNVTILEFEDAMHDIFLSKLSVRERAFDQVFDWMKERL